MCTIDKMLIKGIRSFSPDNTVVLEFYKPLTLIVGHNGAGKTTIIECLKQACTGELPPNTRSGQSFIHDPKVAGESETKAQIKLRFVTPGGQPMVIIRSFLLIQKKLQLQYKTLDQILQTHNKATGQKEAISYRCGDMDRIVPTLMGVTKAIMENVIFVHQEESNWPLSEGAILKKKFDDIFSATKYTKALDAFRKLRLEKVQEVKECKLKLEHLRTHKESAHKLRAEVEQGRQREQALEAQIQGLEDQLQQHKQEMAELDSKIQQCQDFQEALSTLQTRHEVAVGRNATRQVQLVSAYGAGELEVSLEELEQWQVDLEPRLAANATLLDRLGYDIRAAESKAKALKQQHANEIKKEAMLSAEAEAHKRNLAERDRCLRAASQQVGMGQLPKGALTAAATKDFLAAFAQKVADQEKEVRQLKSKNQQQDDEDSQLLDQVTAQITDATQKTKIKRQALHDNEARIARLQHQVEASLVNRVMAQDAEDAEKAAQTRLKAKQDALNGSGFGDSLAKIATELEGVQKKTSALRQERDKLAVAADDGARLQLMRKERNQKQTQLETLVNNRRQRLAALLGCAPTAIPEADKLKAVVDDILQKHEQELSKQASKLQKMQGQASTTQGALTACQTQLNQQQHEVETLQNSVQASLSQIYNMASVQQPLAGCIQDAEKEFITCKSQLARITGLEINYNQFKATAHKNNMCEICKRGFHGPEDRQQFIQMQVEAAACLPDTKVMLEARILGTEGRLKALRALQPDNARLDRLRSTEMAATAERLKQLDANATAEAAAVADLHDQHKAVQQKLQEGQQLAKDVIWQLDRLAGEVASSSREITRLENQMKVAGSTRTVADVDADLEALEAARSQLERSKDEVLRKQGRLRDEISHLQTVWQAAREEAMNMRNAADKREALERDIAATQAANVQLEHEAAAFAESVEPLKACREQRAQERQQRRSAAREREAEQEARLRELHNQQTQLQGHCRTVSAYEQAGKAERLLDTRRALELTSKHQQDQDALLKDLERQQQEAEQKQFGDADSKRQIEDQLDHQRNLQAEASLKAEIQQVQAQIGDVGNIQEIHSRFTELRQISTDLQRTQNMARGSLGTVQEGMQRAQRDLGSVNYRDVDNRYSTQLLEVKTNEMGISDLEKYHKATEKALLAFHTNKMADINKYVKDLWQRTYRNQDIDYIQIKADADGTRSYNYRVVMLAGGAELEMRGRCSAGQRVLACLVIRLALAESFCVNCGILALDEPTTNLDAANSASLAEALRNIMESRKAQTNFQLVVITHDERFAQMIGTKQNADYMYRITKDDNQNSHIEKEELLD